MLNPFKMSRKTGIILNTIVIVFGSILLIEHLFRPEYSYISLFCLLVIIIASIISLITLLNKKEESKITPPPPTG